MIQQSLEFIYHESTTNCDAGLFYNSSWSGKISLYNFTLVSFLLILYTGNCLVIIRNSADRVIDTALCCMADVEVITISKICDGVKLLP